MGYIRHDAVIAVVSDPADLPDIEAFRASLPEAFRALVVGPVPSVVNCFWTYAFLPDGSKEGWSESDMGDNYRAAFVALFADDHWAHVKFGGDGDAAYIVATHDDPVPGHTHDVE